MAAKSVVRIFVMPLSGIGGEACQIYDVPAANVAERDHSDLQLLNDEFVGEESSDIGTDTLTKMLRRLRKGEWAPYYVKAHARMFVVCSPYAHRVIDAAWSHQSEVTSVISFDMDNCLKGEFTPESKGREPVPPSQIARVYRIAYEVF